MSEKREGIGIPVRGPSDLLMAARPKERLIYWFDIPESIGASLEIEKIGMIELTSGEELMATKRIGTEMIRLGFELAKESIRFVNDNPVNTGDGSADMFWERSGTSMAKLRQLVLTAYGVIHNPVVEEVKSFLGSMRTAVG